MEQQLIECESSILIMVAVQKSFALRASTTIMTLEDHKANERYWASVLSSVEMGKFDTVSDSSIQRLKRENKIL